MWAILNADRSQVIEIVRDRRSVTLYESVTRKVKQGANLVDVVAVEPVLRGPEVFALSPEILAGKGVLPFVEAEPLPAHKRQTGVSYEIGQSSVQEVKTSMDIPLSELPAFKARLKAQVADKGWMVEQGGFTFNGIPIATDDRSQAKLLGATKVIERYPERVINWSTTAGFFELDAAAITVIGDAVADHVQACFDAKKVHFEAIDNLTTIQAALTYDINTGWPA